MDESSPTEIFDSVSNATRVEILRALASAYGDSPTDPWLDYTELREAVGLRDTGNFNYHLDRLDDLVVKGPEGYRISRLGMEVTSAIASGTLESERTWGPLDVSGDCLFCEDSLQLRYEDGTLRLTCGTDDHSMVLSGSPSLLDAPDDRITDRIALVLYHQFALAYDGICSECRGYVEGEIELGDVRPDHYHFHGECRRCGFHHGFPVGMVALPQPEVIALFAEHGTDVRSTPFWTLEFCTPGHETVLSEEPLRLRVDVTRGRETLSLTLDREGSVVSVERS